MSMGKSEIEQPLRRKKVKGLIVERPGLAAGLDFLSGALLPLLEAHKHKDRAVIEARHYPV